MDRPSKLLAIWIVALIVAVVTVLGYSFFRDSSGYILLTGEDVLEGQEILGKIYGAYLGANLLAWYTKPIGSRRAREIEARLDCWKIAVVCTVLFNILLEYYLIRGYFNRKDVIVENFRDSLEISIIFSFVVAPVNVFYFGVRQKSSV